MTKTLRANRMRKMRLWDVVPVLLLFVMTAVLLSGCGGESRDTRKKSDSETYEEIMAKKPNLTADEPDNLTTEGSFVRRTYGVENGTKVLQKTETVVNDAKGRKIWECTVDQTKADNTEVEIYAYRYDDRGRVVEEICERHSDELTEGMSIFLCAYAYDGNSSRIRQQIDYQEERINVYDYTYNERGDYLTQTTTYYFPDENGDLTVSRDERKKEYDTYGNLIRLTETASYREEPLIFVDYNEDENKVIRYDTYWILEDTLDEQGRLIRRDKYVREGVAGYNEWTTGQRRHDSYLEYFYEGDFRTCIESREYSDETGLVALRQFDKEGRIILEEYSGDRYTFDWNETDPACPCKLVLHEVEYLEADGFNPEMPSEETYYFITQLDPRDQRYYDDSYNVDCEYTCYFDYVMTGRWYTPDRIYDLEEYKSGSQRSSLHYGEWSITLDTEFDASGRKLSRYQQANNWEEYYYFDERENPVKRVYTMYDGGEVTFSETQVFEYEYY